MTDKRERRRKVLEKFLIMTGGITGRCETNISICIDQALDALEKIDEEEK